MDGSTRLAPAAPTPASNEPGPYGPGTGTPRRPASPRNRRAPLGQQRLDVDEANEVLSVGGYGLRVLAGTGGLRLTGPGTGTGVPLGHRPVWSDLYQGLTRLRRTRRSYDPAWLDVLSRALDNTGVPRSRGLGAGTPAWERFTGAVTDDPVLRMHCAIQASAAPEPRPPHAHHPGGTVAAGPQDLAAPSPALPHGLIHEIVGNRFERRENELPFFLEHFVRPPVRAFRLALDRHRTGLLSLRDGGLRYELSCELQPTGRVVVTEQAGATDAASATAADVRAGVRALVATIDTVSEAFRDARNHSDHEVRAAVDRVIAEELRDLEPHTAEVLAGEHPLQCFVHTVPPEQDDVIKRVLTAVQERTRRRRWDARLPEPIVVVDLDLCAVVPLQRALDAARAVSGPRPGAPRGIDELATPESLSLLPTYAASTWHTFVTTTGLAVQYPGVDWQRVQREFYRCFGGAGEAMRTDTVNAGLARFVWDVRDAGGRVVFCTGRREGTREYTEDVLREAGVPDTELLCMPEERHRPVSEMKVECLRELAGVDVVAVFDDMLANRIAITKEYSDAIAVAVEIPGMATERGPDRPVADGAPVIATFETSPRRHGARSQPQPQLSNTHSLEELQVEALRPNRSAERWAVHLSHDETLALMDSVIADADRAAQRTARTARAKSGIADESGSERPERDRTVRALHHVFTRKQFLKGSRANYQLDDMRRDVAGFLDRDEPIDVVLLGFPIKQCLNRLKAFGPLPDLAEFGAMVRLRELQEAARSVYPPGLHFTVLTDGRHFRPRPASATGTYSGKLREYADLAGIAGCTTIAEIDAVAQQRFGVDLRGRRQELFDTYRRSINDALLGHDITDEPLRTLDSVAGQAVDADGPVLGRSLAMFREMLMSMVYSVPVPAPAGVDRLAWSRLVYADVYNLDDSGVSPEVRRSRTAVLRRSWHNVVRYLATLRVDEALAYDDMFAERVRLTVSAVTPGRCGFTYLGGSGLLPWQGTGVLDRRGRVAADFAVSLLDQGFVPVYSPILGPRQPWMMVPAQHTRIPPRGGSGPRTTRADTRTATAAPSTRHTPAQARGANAPLPGTVLDGDFAARARLRRK